MFASIRVTCLRIPTQNLGSTEVRFVKKVLEQEDLGRPVLIEGNFSTDKGLRLSPNEWRWNQKECPSGPLLQLGVHHIDTFRYLLGTIRAVFSVQKRSYTQAQIVDNTITGLEFEEGCLGYIGSSYTAHRSYSFSVYMTRGKIYYDDDFGLMVFKNGKRDKTVYQPNTSMDNSLLDEIEEFTSCIEQGREPEVSIKDGLLAAAVLEAAIEANRMGKKVYIQKLLAKYGISFLD